MPATTVAPRSTRKAKGEGHERRAEILAAAERIFVEHGYEGATIRKIAEEVGLSSTALYIHFPDKGAILQEICRDAFEALLDGNRRVMEQVQDPQSRMRRLIEAYVDFGFEHPNAYRLVYMTRPSEASAGAESAAQEMGGALFDSFRRVVREADASGLLRGDPEETAQALWAGAHGVVSLVITKPYFPWAPRARLAATMIDALMTGLLKS